MQISPITTTKKNFLIHPTFKAKSIKERMEEYRKKQNWWEWYFEGGKSSARLRSEWALNMECNSTEKSAETYEENANAVSRKYDTVIRSKRNILNKIENISDKLEDITYDNNRIINSLKSQINCDMARVTYNKNLSKNLKSTGCELDKQNKKNQKNVDKLNREYKLNQKNSESIINSELKKAKSAIATQQKQNIEEIEKTIEDANIIIEKLIKTEDRDRTVGLSKIIGYNSEKQELDRIFGKPIEYSNNGISAEIPNGLLLYGPQGCGKTTLARAFAESTGCYIEYFKPTISNDKAYNQLIDIIERAKEKYKQNKIHTFILIDEFDTFAPKDSEKSKRMKNLTDKISSQYHCSILATTNYPENIDKTLLRDGRFEKMAIFPAKYNDAKAIIKHCLKDISLSSFEMTEIINTITINPNGTYSNSQIIDIITKCKNNSLCSNIKLTGNQIVEAFQKNTPVITKDIFNLFIEQIKYVKRI